MTTIVERVARALCTLEGANWDAADFGDTPSGNTPEEMRAGYIEQARAAIAAMLEPTEEMVGAYSQLCVNDGCEDSPLAEDAWRAMIDEALKD